MDAVEATEAALRLALPFGASYELRNALLRDDVRPSGGVDFVHDAVALRALSVATAGAGNNTVGHDLPTLFAAALLGGVPLLGQCAVFATSHASPINASTIATATAPPGVVADGGMGVTTDPAFAALGDWAAYRFPALLTASIELADDGAASGLEQYVASTTVDALAPGIGAQLWRGTGGGLAPTGLASNVSTVAAGSATTVVLSDIENLLNALPAAVQASSNLAIAIHPTAWRQLRAVRDSATAPQIPVTTGYELYGVPVVLDPHLQAPAAAARAVVAGDFANAYAVRLAPTRIEWSQGLGTGFDSYTKQLRIVMRLDGRPVITNSARALLH